MSDSDRTTTGRNPRRRSPGYPGISLPTAIQRAKTLYDQVQNHPLPIAKITSKWGYNTPTSGPATVTYSALKKYGLLADEGSGVDRVGRLTDLAVNILHPSSPNRQDAIKRAALLPPINREWWKRYGKDLPPEDTLEWEYVVRGPFTEKGLREFLRVYRETISFVDLNDPGLASGESDVDDTAARVDHAQQADVVEDPDKDHRRPSSRSGDRSDAGARYAIPVAAGVDIMIEGRFPLIETEWDQFMTVLTAMKPALTLPPSEADRHRDTPDVTE